MEEDSEDESLHYFPRSLGFEQVTEEEIIIVGAQAENIEVSQEMDVVTPLSTRRQKCVLSGQKTRNSLK